jgi:hypothetical protein
MVGLGLTEFLIMFFKGQLLTHSNMLLYWQPCKLHDLSNICCDYIAHFAAVLRLDTVASDLEVMIEAGGMMRPENASEQ